MPSVTAGYKLSEVPEPTGEDYQKAVSVLLPYLLSHRSRLALLESESSSSRAEQRSAGTEAGGPHAQQQQASEIGAALGAPGLGADQRSRLAEVVDTAILKVMLLAAMAASHIAKSGSCGRISIQLLLIGRSLLGAFQQLLIPSKEDVSSCTIAMGCSWGKRAEAF